eukprot:RCo012551
MWGWDTEGGGAADSGLVHLAGTTGPLLVSKHVLLNLACCSVGQLWGELELLRDLESREKGPAVSRDLVRGKGLAGLHHDKGLRDFSPLGVRNGNHRGLRDLGALHQCALDLNAADVLASADDDVLAAVDNLNVAIRVNHPHVPSVEPAPLESLRRGLWVLVVPQHDVVALQADLPDCRGVSRNGLHGAVHHLSVVGRDVGHTLAGLLRRLVLRAEILPLVFPFAQRVRPVALGEPIDVQNVNSEGLKVLDHLGRRGCSCGDHAEALQGRRQGLARLGQPHGVRGQPRDHDGSGAHVGGVLLLQQPHDFRVLHLAQAQVGPRDCRNGPGVAPAIAVEHGQRPHHLGLAVDA